MSGPLNKNALVAIQVAALLQVVEKTQFTHKPNIDLVRELPILTREGLRALKMEKGEYTSRTSGSTGEPVTVEKSFSDMVWTHAMTFNVGSGFSGGYGNNPRVSSIAIQSDDKVVVGHWYDTYDGQPANRGLTRLNDDGSLDDTFTIDTIEHSDDRGLVNDVAIQSDGKIIAAGWFDSYDGTYHGGILRFNSDGTSDDAFNNVYVTPGIHNEYPEWGGARIAALLVDGDKIYVGGAFAWFNDRVKHNVVKLNSDCSIDTTFNVELPYSVSYIDDAGRDTYDGANYLATNLVAPYYALRDDQVSDIYSIPYTHTTTISYNDHEDAPYFIGDGLYNYQPAPTGVIKDGDRYFGVGSQYFTNMYPGMFALVAKDVSIDQFAVLGDLGSDGNATVTTYAYDINVGGSTYGVCVKTNVDNVNHDPSVNHIIVYPGTISSVTRAYNDDGSSDDDSVSNFSASELYYIVVSQYPTAGIDEDTSRTLATKLVQVLKGI